MIVVADTSPINYLILIGKIDVLHALYGEVLIPAAVLRELTSEDAPDPVRRWAESPPEWLRVEQVIVTFEGASDLDAGEREAIQLAIDRGRAQLLIDERVRRRVAKGHSLEVIGTIGILETAEEVGLLHFKSTFDDLLRTTYRASEALLRDVRRRHPGI